MTYQVVLFDLDNTLFDFDQSERKAYDWTLSRAGVVHPERHLERYKQINTSLWRAVERGERTPTEIAWLRFAQLMEAVDLDGDPHVMAADYVTGLGEFGELLPTARNLLDSLVGRCRMALVTNGLTRVQRRKVDRLGLAAFFEAIVISEEVGHAKPDPAIFQLAFDELGLGALSGTGATRTLMVGDSLTSDIAGGQAAGIDTCWFNPTQAPAPPHAPTHQVTTLGALGAIIGS